MSMLRFLMLAFSTEIILITCEEEDGGKCEYDIVGDSTRPREATKVADGGNVLIENVSRWKRTRQSCDQSNIFG
jgi:hypothetical protein